MLIVILNALITKVFATAAALLHSLSLVDITLTLLTASYSFASKSVAW